MLTVACGTGKVAQTRPTQGCADTINLSFDLLRTPHATSQHIFNFGIMAILNIYQENKPEMGS